MYSSIQLAGKYLSYYLTASNGKGHGIHSPFIFQFIREILNDRNEYPAYYCVEQLRKRMLQDDKMLTIKDLGAGSSKNNQKERSVSDIVRTALKHKRFAQLFFRMARTYSPSTILEIGTSLGLTTSYLSLGNAAAKVLTIEGSPGIASYAKNNWEKLGIRNVELFEGDFDVVLPDLLKMYSTLDLVFIDGNHREEPTIRYFNALLQKVGNSSILIFDDIHWSKEMEQAWETIKRHPSVRCSVDLFFIGIVFFRQEFLEKQNFVIRF